MAPCLAAAGPSDLGAAGLPPTSVQSECASANYSASVRKRANPSDTDYEGPQKVFKRMKKSDVDSASPEPYQATNKTPPSITSSESKSVGRRIVHARSLHARKYQSSAIGSGNSSPTGPFGKHIVDSIGQALRGVIDFVYAAQDLESPPTRFYCPSEYEGIGASQVPTDSPKDETFLHRVGFLPSEYSEISDYPVAHGIWWSVFAFQFGDSFLFSQPASLYGTVAVKTYGLLESVGNDLLSLVLSGWGFASYGNIVEDGFSGLAALYNSWSTICYGLGWQSPDIQGLWNMLNSQDFLDALSEYGPAFGEKYQNSWGSHYCCFPNQLAVLVKMLGDQNGVDAQLAVCQGDSANNLNHTMEVWKNPHNTNTAFTVFLHHNGVSGVAGKWAGLVYRSSSLAFRTPDIYFRRGNGRSYHNMVDVSHAFGPVSELALRLQQPMGGSNTNLDHDQTLACGQISDATSATVPPDASSQRTVVSSKSSLKSNNGFNFAQISNDPVPEDFCRQPVMSPDTALNKNDASAHSQVSNGAASETACQRSDVNPNTPLNKTNVSAQGQVSGGGATNILTNESASQSVHWFESPENLGLKSAGQAPKQHHVETKHVPLAPLASHVAQTKEGVISEDDKNRRTRKGPMKMSREDREEADRRSANLREAWVKLVCDAFATRKQIDPRNNSSKQLLRNKLVTDLKIVEQQMRELEKSNGTREDRAAALCWLRVLGRGDWSENQRLIPNNVFADLIGKTSSNVTTSCTNKMRIVYPDKEEFEEKRDGHKGQRQLRDNFHLQAGYQKKKWSKVAGSPQRVETGNVKTPVAQFPTASPLTQAQGVQEAQGLAQPLVGSSPGSSSTSVEGALMNESPLTANLDWFGEEQLSLLPPGVLSPTVPELPDPFNQWNMNEEQFGCSDYFENGNYQHWQI